MIPVSNAYYVTEIQLDDANELHQFISRNKHHLAAYLPVTLAQNLTLKLSTVFTEKKVHQFKASEEFLFLLKNEGADQVLGLVYLKELDWENKQGEFAYCIAKELQGKGLISKSVSALSNYAFESLGLSTLQIITHKTNLGSVKVALKSNFSWQKTLINKFTPPGRPPMDMELYELYV